MGEGEKIQGGRSPMVLLLVVVTVTGAAFGQRVTPQAGAGPNVSLTAQQQAPPAAGAAAPEKPAGAPAPAVSVQQATYLVRSTLMTLNDANRSGNYTVLRDLACPDFQAKNTAADLAQSFSDLRHRNFDLFGAALLDPQFAAAPWKDAGGRLHLRGLFPTRPLQISFDLVFEVAGGQWRLFAISVATPDAPPARPAG